MLKKPIPKIIFFSGAGISQPSGISTFRDSDGLWENHEIDVICNEQTWKRNYDVVHDFYNQRREQLASTTPNIAHKTIVKLTEQYGQDNVINITQNVDNLFQKAGGSPLQVHGELTKMECTACGNIWEIGEVPYNYEEERCPKPNCQSKKGVKPHIVFFGGQAPNYRKMFKSFDHVENPDTIVVVIGTMGNVIALDLILDKTPCKKILCNMEISPDIDEEMYDKVYFESIETAIFKIEKDIEEFWKQQN